jgi:hypothetical protein
MESYGREIKIQVRTEDILDKIYSISQEMPEKTFWQIMHMVFPHLSDKEGNFYGNNCGDASTAIMLNDFMKNNNIKAVDSPREILEMLIIQLTVDLDTISSNANYCLRNKRYLECEKEIACHETITDILKMITPEEEVGSKEE